MILKYSKNYYGYSTGEDFVIHIQDTHKTFIKIHPSFFFLSLFDNSENHHKIAMDDINARKLNPKDGGENTPLLCNRYYKFPDGARVVHAIQNESGV